MLAKSLIEPKFKPWQFRFHHSGKKARREELQSCDGTQRRGKRPDSGGPVKEKGEQREVGKGGKPVQAEHLGLPAESRQQSGLHLSEHPDGAGAREGEVERPGLVRVAGVGCLGVKQHQHGAYRER